jgi:hypothetical protein
VEKEERRGWRTRRDSDKAGFVTSRSRGAGLVEDRDGGRDICPQENRLAASQDQPRIQGALTQMSQRSNDVIEGRIQRSLQF